MPNDKRQARTERRKKLREEKKRLEKALPERFIRLAEPGDWNPVEDLLRKIHADTFYSYTSLPPGETERLFQTSCHSRYRLCLVVADRKYNIYGLFIAVIQKNFVGATCAFEVVAYTPGYEDDIERQYCDWASKSGAEIISVSACCYGKKNANIIGENGFVHAGDTRIKLVSDNIPHQD